MSIVTNGKVGDFSKDTSPVWTSKAAAVSVGYIATDKEGKLDLAKTITPSDYRGRCRQRRL